MKKKLLLAITIVLSFGLTSCDKKTSPRLLTIKGEKAGNLAGIDLTSINKLAKEVNYSSFDNLVMQAYKSDKNLNGMPVPEDEHRVNITYSYYSNKTSSGSSCGISISFEPVDQFYYMSIYNARKACFEQAEKIASDPQIMGTKAKEAFKFFKKRTLSLSERYTHYDGYSLSYTPFSDKHFNNSGFISRIKK